MAGRKTLAQLEAELDAIDADLAELRRVPHSGKVSKTSIDLKGNVDMLYRERQRILSEIALCKRRLGFIGPARRTLY